MCFPRMELGNFNVSSPQKSARSSGVFFLASKDPDAAHPLYECTYRIQNSSEHYGSDSNITKPESISESKYWLVMKLSLASPFAKVTQFQPSSTSHQSRGPHKTTIFASSSLPDDQIVSEFHRLINATNLNQPKITGPSHLLPPTTVVTAQMDALLRNDYPHPDAGLETCFLFSKPVDPSLNTPSLSGRARSWKAAGSGGGMDAYLTYPDFIQQIKTHSFYKHLINAEEWTPLDAGCQFPSSRFDNKAVMGVEVTVKLEQGRVIESDSNKYRFTWLLEKMSEGGLNNCWMIVGVRVGDYVN